MEGDSDVTSVAVVVAVVVVVVDCRRRRRFRVDTVRLASRTRCCTDCRRYVCLREPKQLRPMYKAPGDNRDVNG